MPKWTILPYIETMDSLTQQQNNTGSREKDGSILNNHELALYISYQVVALLMILSILVPSPEKTTTSRCFILSLFY